MKKFLLKLFFTCAACLIGSMSYASNIVVTPGDTSWVSAENSGGGSSQITSAMADDNGGSGSLELTGDKTRFYFGNPWDDTQANALGLLKDVSSFKFDWAVAGDSASNLNANYTPALRLHIYDPDGPANRDQNLELIWEGAYNGVYTSSLSKDTWYETTTTDDFWRWEGEVTMDNGAQANATIAEWSANSSWFTSDAMVMAISVGVGSSAGSDYHAFADYVELSFTDGDSTVWDFETSSAPIPEPATMLLFGVGLLGIAGVSRRKRA